MRNAIERATVGATRIEILLSESVVAEGQDRVLTLPRTWTPSRRAARSSRAWAKRSNPCEQCERRREMVSSKHCATLIAGSTNSYSTRKAGIAYPSDEDIARGGVQKELDAQRHAASIAAGPQTTASWLAAKAGTIAAAGTDPFNIWFWSILFAVFIGLRLYNRASKGANPRTHEISKAAGKASMLRIDPSLDPREWKKEHRVALVGPIGLGCLLGLVFGSRIISWEHVRANLWYEVSNLEITGRSVMYLIGGLLWTLFGGVIGGAIIARAPLATAISAASARLVLDAAKRPALAGPMPHRF